MKITHLSTTLLGAWAGDNSCPFRGFMDHQSRIETGNSPDTDATTFGHVVHETCDQYVSSKMAGEETEPILAIFFDRAVQHGGMPWDRFQDGHQLVEAFIERSVSDPGWETIAAELTFMMDMENTGNVVLKASVTDAEWDLAKKDMSVPFVSTIDRVDRNLEDPDLFRVVDYKTNRVPFSRAEVDGSSQLCIYDIAVRAIWPEACEVLCMYDMLRFGRFATTFPEDYRETFIEWVIHVWDVIQDAPSPAQTLNSFCPYCNHRSQCVEWAGVLDTGWIEGMLVDESEGGQSLAWYHGMYDRARLVEKLAGDIKSKLADALAGRLKESGGETLDMGDGNEVYFQQNPRYEYPMRDVFAILKKKRSLALLQDIATISKTKMDYMLNKAPDHLVKAISPTIQASFVKPTLKIRKKVD